MGRGIGTPSDLTNDAINNVAVGMCNGVAVLTSTSGASDSSIDSPSHGPSLTNILRAVGSGASLRRHPRPSSSMTQAKIEEDSPISSGPFYHDVGQEGMEGRFYDWAPQPTYNPTSNDYDALDVQKPRVFDELGEPQAAESPEPGECSTLLQPSDQCEATLAMESPPPTNGTLQWYG
ncbi:hypothetical protein FA13DRAFT_639492 [Coprinellus micaceus]|uniref:Uncharacterized protein n=1 Tax=Coprinellus micaceus TaxID=71717 RepID=A0A4Y7T756_COPMI|nr:hypothetical protein FA13DRAFT_639492 [Coprinellus micaceus]